MANADRDISIDVDQGTLVYAGTTRAIALMFHLEKEIVNGSKTVADPYVTYGPVPDAHNADRCTRLRNSALFPPQWPNRLFWPSECFQRLH